MNMTICKKLIENCPIAVVSTEGAEQTFRSVNSAFCSVLQRSAHELIGLPISDVVAHGDSLEMLALLEGGGSEDKKAQTSREVVYPSTVYVPRLRTAWGLIATTEGKGCLVVLVYDGWQPESADDKAEYDDQVTELNREIREINQQLVLSSVLQQAAYDAMTRELEHNRIVANEERQTIAYDLHDGLTQYIMAAHLHLESSRMAQRSGNSDKAARELNRAVRFLKESVQESRRLLSGLRVMALDDLGLSGALKQLVDYERESGSWEDVEFAHDVAGRSFGRKVETTVYRVVQEALTNIRKHAETSRVRVVVVLDQDGDREDLKIEVRDWGKGFLPEAKVDDHRHFGLEGIAHRVKSINGTYEIRSVLGEGTTLRVIIPVPEDTGAR